MLKVRVYMIDVPRTTHDYTFQLAHVLVRAVRSKIGRASRPVWQSLGFFQNGSSSSFFDRVTFPVKLKPFCKIFCKTASQCNYE